MTKQEVDSVVEECYYEIFRFCRSKCRDDETAEDITHDTFALLLSRYGELSSEKIRCWLYSTASNKLKEYFRLQKTERSFVRLDETDIPIYDEPGEDAALSDDAFNEAQRRILDVLNENEKQLFIKLYSEHKTEEQAAMEMLCNIGALYTRKSRMKRKIEAIYKQFVFLVLIYRLSI